MNIHYNRSIELEKQINKHLTRLTGVDKNYYAELTTVDLVQLKSVLVDIHNVLTLKLTFSAVNWLVEFFDLTSAEKDNLIQQINSTSPNAKGFDIHHEGKLKIIAEVKCIDPVKRGNKFGAAQRNSILEDFSKLKNGKPPITDTSDYRKFLFLLDMGTRSVEALTTLLKQTKIRVETTKRLERNLIRNEVVILGSNAKPIEIGKEKVYVKVLPLD